ncbi:DUF5690 family protein [Myroides sp. LJL119]
MKSGLKKFTNSKKINTLIIVLSVFLCYTSMYAIRKSFLAAQYIGTDLQFGLDQKTVFVISQVLGYMVSKFIGIKIISELHKSKRVVWLVGCTTFSLMMLGLFSIVPQPYKAVTLFFNGLPLGMIFGIVFSYIEGRRNTELLAAALSATFIFSTGLVKTVGLILMQNFSITQYNMPFTTGLLFFPVFIISVFLLNKSKGPTKKDIQARTQRLPMYKKQRREFLRSNGLGYLGLVIIYMLLTIVRDFRDNFVVDFWAELGYTGTPSLITLTEIPVAVTVLIIAAMCVLIKQNKKAFNFGMSLTALSAMVMILSTILFQKQLISPIYWMIISGIGVYLPYILFHCLVFERLVALLHFKGNVGFLFYFADSIGYLGSVMVLLLKELFDFSTSWKHFFILLNIQSAGIIILSTLMVVWYFSKQTQRKTLRINTLYKKYN